ncbi:MAG: CinA-like protein [Verrucomicrobiales bacterium]|nr:CinA-like protein [Verrucomicrobiales bacterium]
MNIELINTGSELMLGRVLNTHQQWICAQFADLGYVVTRQIAVPDTGPAIQEALRDSLTRADLVVTTGGLGPTSDDLTREFIAQMFGKKLFVDQSALAHIEQFFAQRKRIAPEKTKVQALVPEGAIVLQNAFGTAPGLVMQLDSNPFRSGHKALIVMLPGPPRELRPMFRDQVAPLLGKYFPRESEFVCRTLKSTGLGESYVEEKLEVPLEALTKAGLELGYCARVGEVDVRIVTRGPGAVDLANKAEAEIRERLGSYIFGTGDDSLEKIIVQLLTDRKETVSFAESCTGGHIANRITNVSGASAIFMAGFVTYSNEAKQRLLGVNPTTLETCGAVSELTAREMAQGCRERNQTDYAIAVTGIAGPTGGSEDKPVGTVFIALASAKGTFAEHHVNRYERETFKFVVSQQALDLLRRKILATKQIAT